MHSSNQQLNILELYAHGEGTHSLLLNLGRCSQEGELYNLSVELATI